jgi:2-succinyl-6-hydroxy-2,4-cyclohexadiene-1-carboxylate synthase
MPTINILGVPHAYDRTVPPASSDVLVFVHGWLLSRGYWQPLTDRLAADYPCLTYDLRGFGESQLGQAETAPTVIPVGAETAIAAGLDHSSLDHLVSNPWLAAGSEPPPATAPPFDTASYSLISYARDLGILLHELQINNAWLVGHSLGGSIALWAADQLPEQVKGVICLNAGGGIYLKEEFERFRAAGQQLLKLRPRWLCHFPLLDLLFSRASVARAIDRTWGRQRLLDFVSADPAAALGTLLDSTTEAEVHRLPQVVARLRQPVYFIAGDQDPIMEPKYVRHLASFHPKFGCCGDNVIEIPDCGHMAMVEQADLVAAQIRSILEQEK